jgi:hypothetical protein
LQDNEKYSHLRVDDVRNLETHLSYPVADIPVDEKKMTIENLNDDGSICAFPHVYIRLSPGYNQRLIPLTSHKNYSQFGQVGKLGFDIKFKDVNTIDWTNTFLLMYALYNDVHATYTKKEKKYSSPYNQKDID